MEGKKKSKTKANQKSTDGPLVLTYTLAELPSSQHRAGLVGLVLLVRHLRATGVHEADAAVQALTPEGVSFAFTKNGMQALFDTAFAATWCEVVSDKIYKSKQKQEIPPIRTEKREVEDKKGKKKERLVYIYRKPVPDGAYLAKADPDGPWIKLWRDMLWAIPRGVPATRKAFEARAEGVPCSDGNEMFDLLRASPEKSIPLSSTYFLGAQASTADNVTFADAARFQLLLHFWPFATELFVPTTLTREGKTEFDGYAFVFPDVADLEAYCDDYPDFLRGRGKALRAYLPRAAVVDLPGEAGLRTMDWLSLVLANRAQQGPTHGLEDLVLAVDVVHARKDGNNVRILSASRIEPRFVPADAYQRLARADLWSPTVRRQLLVNLLGERPWYTGFAGLFARLPSDLTFDNSGFQHDARQAFNKEITTMDDGTRLPDLVFRITTHYLQGMLRSKYQMQWLEQKDKPKKWNDNKEKLAKEALLAMRSRTGDDFIAYVSTTVFAVAQGLNKEDYMLVADALLKETETFRTLLMLAFSAQMPWSSDKDNNSKKEEA